MQELPFSMVYYILSEESMQEVLQRSVMRDQLAEALELYYAALCGFIETQPQQNKAKFVLVKCIFN